MASEVTDAAARERAVGVHAVVSDINSALADYSRTLNALRETQLEQVRRLGSLDAKLGSLDAKLDQGFSMLSVRMAHITTLLTNLTRKTGEKPSGRPDQFVQDGPSGTD